MYVPLMSGLKSFTVRERESVCGWVGVCDCVCVCVWLPSSMGTFRPQNSTVSFKNELGIQWYTLSRLSSGVDGSWGQFSNLDAWIHWLILVGSGHESTLWTHFGKLAPLHIVQFMKIIWKKKCLSRFKETMTIDKLAPSDVKNVSS